MGILVDAWNIATANNTVAIVMANPIAADMAKTHNIPRCKTGIYPRYVTTLRFSKVSSPMAHNAHRHWVTTAKRRASAITAFQIIPCLNSTLHAVYISLLVFIFLIPDHQEIRWRRYEVTEAAVS